MPKDISEYVKLPKCCYRADCDKDTAGVCSVRTTARPPPQKQTTGAARKRGREEEEQERRKALHLVHQQRDLCPLYVQGGVAKGAATASAETASRRARISRSIATPATPRITFFAAHLLNGRGARSASWGSTASTRTTRSSRDLLSSRKAARAECCRARVHSAPRNSQLAGPLWGLRMGSRGTVRAGPHS